MEDSFTIRDYVGLVVIFAGVVWAWVHLIRGTIQRKRDRLAVQQRCREAKAKILADGKIEGPKGKYRPRNWSRKWRERFNDLPEPRSTVKTNFTKTHGE